jgi:type I restriction enzyme S subunit
LRYKFEDIAINSIVKRKPTDDDMRTYIGLEHLDTGDLRVIRFGSKVPIKGEKLLMTKGDMLFGRRNTYLKRAAIAPHDGLFSAHGMILRPKEKVIAKEFFPFFISSDYFFDAAIRISVGSISPTVNWGTLKTLEFELPTIDHQKQLSKILWAAIETRNAYKTLFLLTEQLVKSRFVEMFGDPVTNPMGWEETTIGECCMLKSGTSLPLYIENEGGEIPYVKVGDMTYKDNTKYITTSSHMVTRETAGNGLFPINTVIFPKRGAAIATNKKRLTQCEICADLNVMGIIPDNTLAPIYLLTFFENIDLGEINNGSSVPQINNKDIVPLVICVPPLSLQNRFAEFVQQADKSKFELQRTISELESTYKAILRENLG